MIATLGLLGGGGSGTNGGEINVVTMGAVPGASGNRTVNTTVIQAAMNSGKPVYIPPGDYNITVLEMPSNLTMYGAGWGSTNLVSNVTGNAAILRNKSTAVGQTTCVNVWDLGVMGTDGSGGTALWLDSFSKSNFLRLRLRLCRNAGDTGRGLYMENSLGNCVENNFEIMIEDCDTALLQISTNAAFTVGYCHFRTLVIFQEKDCIALLVGSGGGGQYNVFSDIVIQGNAGAGSYITIEGISNILDGIVIDNPGAGTILSFANAGTQNNFVRFLGGFNIAKYTNNQSTGTPNTLIAAATMSLSPGKTFQFIDPLGDITMGMRATGVAGAANFRMGNDTSATLWQFAMSASATPTLSITTAGALVMLLSSNRITLGLPIVDAVQSLSGAGAVNLTTGTTEFTSTGAAQALSLANGTSGQVKRIVHIVDGGSGVLTPTTKSGFTTITFTNVGDAVTLEYCTTAGWCIVGIFGAVAA